MYEIAPVGWNIQPLNLSVMAKTAKNGKKNWCLNIMLPFLFLHIFGKKTYRELGGGWSKRKKDSHKKGSLASEHVFYYHEDHFYILFTLM